MSPSPAAARAATPEDGIDFGELPPEVDELLQAGVVAYRHSASEAEARFRKALALAPNALPVYFCLYKIHTYRGDLEAALAVANQGLREAAEQAGWPLSFRDWPAADIGANAAGRFALYTLKALAFIRLKRGELAEAREALARLEQLDPKGWVGWPVIQALLGGLTS